MIQIQTYGKTITCGQLKVTPFRNIRNIYCFEKSSLKGIVTNIFQIFRHINTFASQKFMNSKINIKSIGCNGLNVFAQSDIR